MVIGFERVPARIQGFNGRFPINAFGNPPRICMSISRPSLATILKQQGASDGLESSVMSIPYPIMLAPIVLDYKIGKL